MSRSLTSRNLLEKHVGRTVKLSGVLAGAVGDAECRGCWIIYGAEKNGKTWFALTLAKDIAQFERVGYVSAEEGLDKSFRDACHRAGITASDKILWDDYLTIDEIVKKYRRPRTPNVVFIDNLTMYSDEIKPTELKKKTDGRAAWKAGHFRGARGAQGGLSGARAHGEEDGEGHRTRTRAESVYYFAFRWRRVVNY